jgi:hypothetical protein
MRGEAENNMMLGIRTRTPLDPARTIREDVANHRLFVWDNGGAVSMATWAGRTDRSVRIGIAYTPPELRGRGYAKQDLPGYWLSVVASLVVRTLSAHISGRHQRRSSHSRAFVSSW